MVASWIFEQNLEAFLEMLAYIAGCKLNDWDFAAVVAGIPGTNDETGKWFAYEFVGNRRIVKFDIADDPGSSVLHFRVVVPEDAECLVDLAFFVASGNDVTPHNSVA